MKKFQRIRDLREDAELKQAEIAKSLCCSQRVYSHYERGTRRVPADILIAMAQYYNTSVDYILGLTNEPGVPWNDWPANK